MFPPNIVLIFVGKQEDGGALVGGACAAPAGGSSPLGETSKTISGVWPYASNFGGTMSWGAA